MPLQDGQATPRPGDALRKTYRHLEVTRLLGGADTDKDKAVQDDRRSHMSSSRCDAGT